MELLGQLERSFATSLYPNRVPIAIGLAVLAAAVAAVAWRRRWDLAARRHPRRTAAIGVPLLVVGITLGWYLGSPLVLRTELTEAAPVATGVPGGTGGATVPGGTGGATVPGDAELVGTFSGADEFHFGRGTARLIRAARGWTLRLEEFSVRNGPDLYVYLSTDPAGYADGAIELGRLRATDGSFNQDVPAGTDISAVRSVVIWCRQFAVQFAVAPLAAG